MIRTPVPVAALSKAWDCGRSLVVIAGSNPTVYMAVCCQYCVLSGRGICVGLIAPPGYSYRFLCLAECHHESSSKRRPWPTGGCCVMVKKIITAKPSGTWVYSGAETCRGGTYYELSFVAYILLYFMNQLLVSTVNVRECTVWLTQSVKIRT